MDTREHKSTVLPIAGQVKCDKNEGQSTWPINLSHLEKPIYEAGEQYGAPFRSVDLKPWFPDLSKDALRQRVYRMWKDGLLLKVPGRFGYYELSHWRDGTRGQKFLLTLFKPGVPFLVHNLELGGIIPGAFNTVSGKKGWRAKKTGLKGKLITKEWIVTLLSHLVGGSDPFSLTIEVWSSDKVQVKTANSESPLTSEGYSEFLHILRGIFLEVFGCDLTRLYVQRFHFHQDRIDLEYEGGYVSLQLFTDTWLMVYRKDSLPGRPTRVELGIITRKLGLGNLFQLMQTKADEIQAVNLLVSTYEGIQEEFKSWKTMRQALAEKYRDTFNLVRELKTLILEKTSISELWEEKILLLMRGEQEPVLKEIEKLKEFIKPILDLLSGEVVQSRADRRLLAERLAEKILRDLND